MIGTCLTCDRWIVPEDSQRRTSLERMGQCYLASFTSESDGCDYWIYDQMCVESDLRALTEESQTEPQTDAPELEEWPDEIYAFQIQEYETSGTYVCSEFATTPRWEGDKERDRPVERFVHGNVFDSQQRYYETMLEQARAENAALCAQLAAAREVKPMRWNGLNSGAYEIVITPERVASLYFYGNRDEDGKPERLLSENLSLLSLEGLKNVAESHRNIRILAALVEGEG